MPSRSELEDALIAASIYLAEKSQDDTAGPLQQLYYAQGAAALANAYRATPTSVTLPSLGG